MTANHYDGELSKDDFMRIHGLIETPDSDSEEDDEG